MTKRNNDEWIYLMNLENVESIFKIVHEFLGKDTRMGVDLYSRHWIVRINYEKKLNLWNIEPQLRQCLDSIGWQFITTGKTFDNSDDLFYSFGVAPINIKTVSAAYHVTRA